MGKRWWQGDDRSVEKQEAECDINTLVSLIWEAKQGMRCVAHSSHQAGIRLRKGDWDRERGSKGRGDEGGGGEGEGRGGGGRREGEGGRE